MQELKLIFIVSLKQTTFINKKDETMVHLLSNYFTITRSI